MPGGSLLAGGAVETARLLQLSALGNDWVGDCLQGHTYAGAFGRFDEIVIDGLGPGPVRRQPAVPPRQRRRDRRRAARQRLREAPRAPLSVGATTWRAPERRAALAEPSPTVTAEPARS